NHPVRPFALFPFLFPSPRDAPPAENPQASSSFCRLHAYGVRRGADLGKWIVAAGMRAYNPWVKRGALSFQEQAGPIRYGCLFATTEGFRAGLPAVRPAPAPGVF